MPNIEHDSTLIWLRPGMHIKRWLILLVLGIVLLALGLAYLLRYLYADVSLPSVVYYLTLQFLPRSARALLLGGLGIGLTVLSLYQLGRSLLNPFVRPGDSDVARRMIRHHQRRRGPRIVALGGGTGLSTLLRGLKEYSDNITAIVSVADDGGSSGLLRQATGMLPPGDIRQCIVALSEAEGLTGNLFEYRFTDDYGLEGHNFGNLFIAAMSDVTGSFEAGVMESSRVLAVRGRVIPSTLQQVTLAADLRVADGSNGHGWRRVVGESAIPAARQQIERIFLQPEKVTAYPEAIRAILEAEIIVAGPGSLFTSVLPNLLVPSIAAAIQASSATRIYVVNVATQPGETADFDTEAHVEALRRHVGDLLPVVLANDHLVASTGDQSHLEPVALPATSPEEYLLLTADVIDESHPWRHDPAKLARVIMDIHAEPAL
ncbi:MAG: uridine diphosphate-N-acetylglucosamine-binding protein YvcK [Chloroflexota bacterium]|nr:uridine diphosphate-N-acetylglucosamine-binding protein YvcK [Chloroflexota bacterium]